MSDNKADDKTTKQGKSDNKADDVKTFWVEGYGNVDAKSQSEAESKAKKILEDRRK